MGRKPKQFSSYKKWSQLSLKQREYVINEGRIAYRKERKIKGRPLDKSEKYALIKTIKLRCWVPLQVLKPKMMNVFDGEENLVKKELNLV